MIPKKVIRTAYGRIKIEPITNSAARNQTFRKRKKGLFKKANELSTLCSVKVCAFINSCDNTETEFWPSREGAEAGHSAFMGVLPEERCKKMYDQERHLEEKIQKGQEKAMRLQAENREIELREVIFDLLKGKTLMPHQYGDPSFMRELNLFIGGYANKVSLWTQFLEGNVEPVPPNVVATDAPGPVVGDVNPVVVGTKGSVINPTEAYDHIPQYDGMDMSVNEQVPGGSNDHVYLQNMNPQEPFQYQTPTNFYDQTQPMFYGSSQGMNMNLEEPFQYQTPANFDDQTQPMFYGSSQDMYTGLSHDQGQSSNQYANANQQFMSLLMGRPQQMSDVQDPASVASMDDNNNRYQQLLVTSQIPSTTTTTTTTAGADFSGHSINNGWPIRFGLD
ncbi:PREDICTED: MADS-box transcription factor PHERES 1-like [Brassica oleracea var. oleracea]|uniref:MADS-box domain-containing protein n=1 Tax=Brassica oleracea var. oleracea TaxID=109376 RepID=A0A0D3AXE7_BRAOL|nr:PREDICTED: MADS-box transcription factor PHERES 1-like [Brassica oleracea var. oleracea]